MAQENDPNDRRQQKPGDDQFKCGRCGEGFNSDGELRQHEELSHANREGRNREPQRGNIGE